MRVYFSLKKTFLFFCFVFLTFLNAKAQSEVEVDKSRGVASVHIPLCNFNIKDLQSSVSLNYSARSVKVKSGREELPEGWSLDAGGTVSRILRGLPDEYEKTGDNRKGWLMGGVHALAQNFSIADDNNSNTCTDESTNRSNILSNWGYTLDSEPDWFVVDAPDLNCKIMLDNTNTFKVIPARDLKIEFLGQGSHNKYFVITKTNGVKYTFSTKEVETKTVVKTYTNNALEVFNREYEYYKVPVTYTKTWHLTEITSSNDMVNRIYYEYTSNEPDQSASNSNVFIYNGSNAFDKVPLYTTILNSDSKPILKGVGSGISGFQIDLASYYSNAIKFEIFNGANAVKIELKCRDVNSGTRLFLESITETSNACTSTLYKFEYKGCNFQNFTSTLPLQDSENYDAWGYFNNLSTQRQINVYPSLVNSGIYKPYPLPNYSGEFYALNGSLPVIDETSIDAGVLSKITYPSGGSSNFEYESNSFWDPDGNVEIKGSGIRVKKITHFDGINTNIPMIQEFKYNVPGQSRTSGTIKSLPLIALTTNYYTQPYNAASTLTHSQILGLTSQQSANYWKYLTIVKEGELEHSSTSVIYQNVSVNDIGNGRTEYLYSIPSNLWTTENNSTVYPAMTCTVPKPSGLPVKRSFTQLPFSYKENNEYGEGLLLQAKTFSETNKQIKVLDYEYEDYSSNPQIIYGMGFDLVYGNLLFSKYGLTINAKLLKKEKETIFDTGTSTNSFFTEVSYDNSAPDKAVRSKTTINSDNTTVKTSYIYSSDFDFNPGQIAGDAFADGIYRLNQKYMKTMVLEKLEQRKEPGTSAFKVYGAELYLFKKNGPGNAPVLAERKNLTNVSGLSNFLPLSFNGTSMVYNNSYRSSQIFTDFNMYDMPQVIEEKRVKTGIKYVDILQIPAATFTGAELSNVAFSTFEGNIKNLTENNFTDNDYTVDAYTGSRAGILRAGNDLSASITKMSDARVYNLSFWGKSPGSGNLQILVNNISVGTIAVNTSSKYVFYQKHLNLTSTPSNFTVKLISSSPVTLDDVVFSPEEVDYQLITYNFPYGRSSETNSSGKTAFYEYDAKGRPTIVRDAEKNITKYQSYRNYNVTNAALSAGFSMQGTEIIAGNAMMFNTENNCLDGVSYTWNFGDGSSAITTYEPQVSHTFPPGSSYTVTLTATHPEYGTKTTSMTIGVKLDVQICIAGPETKDICGKIPIIMGGCSTSYPAPMYGSTVYVTDVSGCSSNSNYQYQWERFVNGYWTVVGSNVNQYSVPNAVDVTLLRCKVTSSCGTSGYSNVVRVEFYRSENCPTEDEI